jgi:murein DD-endopeptidase MepM/ murein hydrolase activator NlpD
VTTPAPVVTTTPTPATGTTFTAGQARAIAINKSGTRVRSGSGVGHAQIGSLPYLASATVLGSRPEDNNASRYKWVNISFQGVNGWAREDYLRIEGDRTAFGLGSNDYYTSPMDRCWWVRDFNLDGNAGVVHWGWDLGADTGEPIYSGPMGGTVVRVFRCTKCTPDRPNTPSQGFSIGDSRILSDAGWGFGYGHFVTVRYDHNTLPQATKQILASRGIPGAHIFALYAHLFSIDCTEGQVLAPRTRIASCGNTGNSEATHLHLEIRASTNPNEQWSNMMKNLLDPTVLFVR